MALDRKQVDMYPLRCVPYGAYLWLTHSGLHGRMGHKRTCRGSSLQLPQSHGSCKQFNTDDQH